MFWQICFLRSYVSLYDKAFLTSNLNTSKLRTVPPPKNWKNKSVLKWLVDKIRCFKPMFFLVFSYWNIRPRWPPPPPLVENYTIFFLEPFPNASQEESWFLIFSTYWDLSTFYPFVVFSNIPILSQVGQYFSNKGSNLENVINIMKSLLELYRVLCTI